MFLLVPAYPGCPGSKAVKRSLLLVLLLYVLYSVRVIPLLIFDGQTVTANGLFF